MKYYQIIGLSITLLFLNSCATYQPQYKDEANDKIFPQVKEISHTFYLIGDAGNSPPQNELLPCSGRCISGGYLCAGNSGRHAIL